ncbi:hypothetical protein M409DRAFT_52631 [Zasmidium cellare ATCC 36951]|uniref:Protein kinase domain-containing protein n=1 Tax=Zasmidium cellare ATCC 36951 TaxID=1080233 RepID=A0A6A6CU80_ZASCE|nr:uncharacterized protein M409DRAFT_52631 [Zasmidium cellare ATCC 36951]KAF2169382.1 hypothetical protein M409DRAFT_52631 [Zasmidium cellare ATCC 36951]
MARSIRRQSKPIDHKSVSTLRVRMHVLTITASLIATVRAEYRTMTNREADNLLQFHRRLEAKLENLEEQIERLQSVRDEVERGKQLTRPDPNIPRIKRYMLQAEAVIDVAHVVRREAQQILDLRLNHATEAGLVWVRNLLRECGNLEEQRLEEIKVAEQALQKADGGRKMMRPHDARERRVESLKQNFVHEPLDPNHFMGQWEAVIYLCGGISQAGLWVLHNQHGKVIDRIVRKNDYMDYRKWFSTDLWHGHSKDFQNRIPLEFWLRNKCCNVSDKHFARMRAWSQDHQNMVLSLYVEYCSFEDLGAIQQGYLEPPAHFVPEATLWMIFKHLVECCLVMRQGGIRTADPDWQQIVHRDIKPRNVFMDDAAKSYFPRYPTPKMGDFGLAIQTDEKDPMNPQFYNRGAGTRPYMAPEQMPYVNDKTNEPMDDWQLLDYTNVYGIGALMYSLLIGGLHRHQQPDFLDEREKWETTNDADDFYSRTLRDLIMSCIEWRPSDRKTLDALLEEVESAINTVDYLNRAAKGVQEADDYHDLWYQADQYRLELAQDSSSDTWEKRSEDQAPGASDPPSTDVEIVMQDT